MKKSLHTLLMIAVILTSLACATLTGGNAVPVSEETIAPVNTLPPPVDTVAVPTRQPTNTAAPVNTPTVAQQEFFTEEFESDAYLE